MRKIKRMIGATLALSIISLSACAGLVIKTWILSSERNQLERYKDGKLAETKSLADANGYRCYSRADDQAWRTAYAQAQACCNSRGSNQ